LPRSASAPRAGSVVGWFHCSHSHCAGRTLADVFEALPGEAVEKAKATKGDQPLDDWRAALVRGKANKQGHAPIVRDVANVALILTHDPHWSDVLAFDEHRQSVVKLTAPPWHSEIAPGDARELLGDWTDVDATRVMVWLSRAWGMTVQRETVIAAVRAVAERRRIHPIRDYLDGLAWDGTHRLGQWLATFLRAKGDRKYLERVGTYWMISAVARVFDPGVKADHVLVLEGGQGAGKSTAFKVLAGRWFADSAIDIGSKDAYLALRGRWIVEVAEFADVTRQDVGRVKAFLSSAVDSYRPPYGSAVVEVPRSCVFGASINPDGVGYLRDSTGSRRFWPVAVGAEVNLDELEAVRDQLWAEAVAAYRSGARWFPGPDDRELFADEAEARTEADEWSDRIGRYLAELGPAARVTTGDVLAHALGLPADRWGVLEQRRAARVLRALGREQQRERRGATVARVWVDQRAQGGSMYANDPQSM
jgi:putative DNA primase/helicase